MAVGTSSSAQPAPATPASAQQDVGKDAQGEWDIVRSYKNLLATDPEMTMPVAALESLIELLHAMPSSTSMETVQVVKDQKAKLLAASPNPLPILAGADLFEQFLLRSLRGPAADEAPGQVLSFEDTRAHLLQNRQLFATRAREARDAIATVGSKYVLHDKVVLTAGGSRVVTSILLRAAADRTRHFKVYYVRDGSPRTDASIAALREAGLEVSTINQGKIAHVMSSLSRINLVLVGTEVVLQNGGIISRMGTSQLAFLTKHLPGSRKRFYVAAETHKIVRVTPLSGPIVNRVGVRQEDVSTWDNIGRTPENVQALLAEEDEVDYTDPELIDGIITEQGTKMTSQIWEMVEDYI
jgi:translation initiation factor eIF-2B subunit alpha